MNKSKRLKPIIKIADEREQIAIKQFLQAQSLYREREARFNELINYREEYQAKFTSTDGVARSAFQFNDYRAFLHRLDITINEQRKLVLASEHDLEVKRKVWMKRREKTQALQKAAERFQAEELALQNKKEQNDADERAQRSGRSSLGMDE